MCRDTFASPRLYRASAGPTSPAPRTGIFVHMPAKAVRRACEKGHKRIGPYWRVIEDDGSLDGRVPGGVARPAEKPHEGNHTAVTGKGAKLPKLDVFEKRSQWL